MVLDDFIHQPDVLDGDPLLDEYQLLVDPLKIVDNFHYRLMMTGIANGRNSAQWAAMAMLSATDHDRANAQEKRIKAAVKRFAHPCKRFLDKHNVFDINFDLNEAFIKNFSAKFSPLMTALELGLDEALSKENLDFYLVLAIDDLKKLTPDNPVIEKLKYLLLVAKAKSGN